MWGQLSNRHASRRVWASLYRSVEREKHINKIRVVGTVASAFMGSPKVHPSDSLTYLDSPTSIAGTPMSMSSPSPTAKFDLGSPSSLHTPSMASVVVEVMKKRMDVGTVEPALFRLNAATASERITQFLRALKVKLTIGYHRLYSLLKTHLAVALFFGNAVVFGAIVAYIEGEALRASSNILLYVFTSRLENMSTQLFTDNVYTLN